MDKKRGKFRKSPGKSLRDREKGAHGGRGVVNLEGKTRGRERSASATSRPANSQGREGYRRFQRD